MNHLNEGLIRRSLDEPLILTGRDRDHLRSCEICAERERSAREDHSLAMAALDGPMPELDLQAARRRLPQAAPVRRGPGFRLPVFRPHVPAWGLAPALAAVLIGAVVLTPANGLARSFLTIFQPARFTPISVTSGELQSLPDLRHYGRLHIPKNIHASTVTTAPRASALSGYAVKVPASLPSWIPGHPQYQVLPGQQSWFTFSARKAKAVARRLHRSLARMPAKIDGSTVQVQTHPAVIAIYGNRHTLPDLVIGQTPAPTISSSGAGFRRIERYLIHLPGVSPSLAQQIQSIGNPTTSLPIPVPVNLAYAQHITINGVSGLFVGDNTGVASVVIWQANGVVYGVAGTLTKSAALAIAASLH